METETGAPTGVKELIARLRDQGVRAGKEEAERLLKEAREQASQMVARAQTEAAQIRDKAHGEIQAERDAAREAIQLAFRDTELRIKSEFKGAFQQYVRRLVTAELGDREVLRRLILQIAGQAAATVPEGRPVEILVSRDWFTSAGDPAALPEGDRKRLDQLLLGLSRDMLREGVELRPSGQKEAGIRIRLVGQDLEIDLSDETLSRLLLQCLNPRYRAIVQGVE
jgi:V/A-type H+/Na+-transporting ATPase subunit E